MAKFPGFLKVGDCERCGATSLIHTEFVAGRDAPYWLCEACAGRSRDMGRRELLAMAAVWLGLCAASAFFLLLTR